MSINWWENPYKGGPMVAVKGFPRPLYPPDAAEKGKKPSVDGPDVEAYKRTVARAGRWQWQPFDQAFSNAFSHGKSGNVGETGVAGVQRQQNLNDTGWIGEATFNLLRSMRCPPGPHVDEMCMDARSVELINQAYKMFGGKEPPPETKTSSAKTRLKIAQGQLGVKESPANTNQTKYGSWYNMNGEPWCAIFITWCDQTGGVPSGSFQKGNYYSYVPYVVNDARMGIHGLKITSDPQPGDLVCYDWSRDGEYDHIGVFEKWTGGRTFQAIEGNTSTTDNSNGGQVMRRQRDAGAQNTVFVHVKEP